MDGCTIIELNARFSDGKPIDGLTDTPLQSIQCAIMKQARQDGKSAMEAYNLANKAKLYPINFRNIEAMQENDLLNIERHGQSNNG